MITQVMQKVAKQQKESHSGHRAGMQGKVPKNNIRLNYKDL